MPASATVRERKFRRDGGLQGHAKRILDAAKRDRAAVKVGLPLGSAPYPDGTDVIMVGVVHEFGEPKLGIPMRSFLRAGIAEHDAELKRLIRKLARASLDGKIEEQQALELLGTKAAAIVQQKIVEGPFAALKPATIARKGSSSPLIDTGHLRQSITYQVVS